MKKIVIILIIGIIVVTATIIGLVVYMQSSSPADGETSDITVDAQINRVIQEVKQDTNFYRIKKCVDAYAVAINEIATKGEGDIYDEYDVYDPGDDSYDVSQNMLNILGKEYVQEFNITKENIAEKFQNGQKSSIVTILHIYKADNSSNVSTYLAYGMMRDTRNQDVEGVSVMVVLDNANDTFAIYPEEYMKQHGYYNMEVGQELDLPEIESIEENNNNVMESIYVSAEQSLNYCFSAYKELALYSRETAYTLLNDEYKEKRFPTFGEYDAYVQSHYLKVMGMSLEKYSKDLSGDTTRYICVDQNDNYYILTEHGAMDFDIQLDIYTLDTTEFLTKYNAGNYQDRVVLNLNKVQEAINDGDYRYMYNHLDETFKQNNFATFEAFSNYMQERYFAKNVFSFDSYEEAGEVASCTVKITNGDNSAESRNQSFIMKLGEGTDFVMSFQI